MLRLKPQTAYNSDYHETLFFDGYHYDCLTRRRYSTFRPTIISVKYVYKIPSVFGFRYVFLSVPISHSFSS